MTRLRRKSRRHYQPHWQQIANPITIKPRFGLLPGIVALLSLAGQFLMWLDSIGILLPTKDVFIWIDGFGDLGTLILLILGGLFALPMLIGDYLIYGIWFPKRPRG